jgi:ribonuclease P protein component
MFPQKNRITKKENFNNLYKNGLYFKSEYLRIILLPNNLKYNRFAIIVSKKVSTSAIFRNSLKRTLRHIITTNDINFLKKVDMLLITFPDIKKVKKSHLKEDFKSLIKKVKKSNHTKIV